MLRGAVCLLSCCLFCSVLTLVWSERPVSGLCVSFMYMRLIETLFFDVEKRLEVSSDSLVALLAVCQDFLK